MRMLDIIYSVHNKCNFNITSFHFSPVSSGVCHTYVCIVQYYKFFYSFFALIFLFPRNEKAILSFKYGSKKTLLVEISVTFNLKSPSYKESFLPTVRSRDH
jgi:hypothetical protein